MDDPSHGRVIGKRNDLSFNNEYLIHAAGMAWLICCEWILKFDLSVGLKSGRWD